MLIRSLAGFVVIIAAMGLVTSVYQLFIARMLQGVFAGFSVMAMAVATVSCPRDKVPVAIARVQSAQLLSVAVGPVAGGYVASHFGIRAAFFVTAAFLVFRQPGKADVRTSVDSSGAFALYLEPGAYSISAAPPPMGGLVEPSQVRVPATGTVEGPGVSLDTVVMLMSRSMSTTDSIWRMRRTRDRPLAAERPATGTPLPALWHWLYFLPLYRQGDVGLDDRRKRP